MIRVGDVPTPSGVRTTAISGADPYKLAAAIDRFASAAAGKASSDVVIASGDDPQYAMPAAGWAAESGNPILFVSRLRDPAGHPSGAPVARRSRTSSCWDRPA